jgi:hypothetical protein
MPHTTKPGARIPTSQRLLLQDQESGLDGSGLAIAFGHFSKKAAKGVKVGQMLRAALEREGFNVDWDGDSPAPKAGVGPGPVKTTAASSA